MAIVTGALDKSPEVKITLPDHTQLPDKDGIPVRNSQEPIQSRLLTDSLQPILRRIHPDEDYFIGEDCGIYWRLTDPPLQGCKSPDWYYVPGVPHLLKGELRRSYVLWQEHAAPYLILEYASGDGSEERDRTPDQGKFWIYERRIRPAFYGIYEPDPGTIELYRLVEDHFELVPSNGNGRYSLPQLGVELGIWLGRYEEVELPWMRWWDEYGALLPTSAEIAEWQKHRAEQEKQRAEQEKQRAEQEKQRAEQEKQRAEQEKQRAEQEKQRAEQEKQRAEKLAEKLRSLGINPDEL
jgi:Uma2 family endonuclease